MLEAMARLERQDVFLVLVGGRARTRYASAASC